MGDIEDTPHVHDARDDIPESVRRIWARDQASAQLGIECLAAGMDHSQEQPHRMARTRMRVTEDMLNGQERCHGGVIFTLADTAMALSCHVSDDAEPPLEVAASSEITYVAPARAGDVLVATAREQAAYGRNGVTDVWVTRVADDQVIALLRGRSRALPSPS